MKNSVTHLKKWKVPGKDKITAYWWSVFSSTHESLREIFNYLLQNPNNIPDWFLTGRTTLVPKTIDTSNPANYRPITCLPIMYKILSSIISQKMTEHLKRNKLVPNEQKGCAQNTYGCIDQLLIDSMITDIAKSNQRNLSMCWIDYSKAFDSVPHDYIIEMLKVHQFDPKIQNFYKHCMPQWKTTLNIKSKTELMTTDNINIKTGIFQGDIPSPVCFIISLLPLSFLLNETKLGFSIEHGIKINHLLFMDDIKIYASSDNELDSLVKTVKIFSDDITMKFGLNKCNKTTILKGRQRETNNNIRINSDQSIKELKFGKTYKYLGFAQSSEIKQRDIKDNLKAEYYTRIKKNLKTELNSKNLITALNTLAVPAITYGFAVLDWSETELEEIDRKTRKLLHYKKALQKTSNVDRLYLPRKKGGRGLVNITSLYKRTVIDTYHYLFNTNEPLLKSALRWSQKRGQKSIKAKATIYSNEVNQDANDLLTLPKETVKSRLKNSFMLKRLNSLQASPLHGQYYRQINEPHINSELTLAWVPNSNLKPASESTIFAIQEQAISTNYIKTHIHKTCDNDICRLCKSFPETIYHITAGCPELAPNVYTTRHNNVANYVYIELLLFTGLLNERIKWFQIKPNPVLENERYKILWNLSIQTDHQLMHNKPDIVYIDKEEKSAMIIDIAIPMDSNIAEKRYEKIRNYTDLAIEIKTMWNLTNVSVVPIIIGCTGSIHRELLNDLSKLNIDLNKKDIINMQEITILGTNYVWRHFCQRVK